MLLCCLRVTWTVVVIAIRCTSLRILMLCVGTTGDYMSMKQWSFGPGRGIPLSLIVMGVPGSQGASPGGLVGPPEQNARTVGGSPPDRVDQLFGFCTSFRPPA